MISQPLLELGHDVRAEPRSGRAAAGSKAASRRRRSRSAPRRRGRPRRGCRPLPPLPSAPWQPRSCRRTARRPRLSTAARVGASRASRLAAQRRPGRRHVTGSRRRCRGRRVPECRTVRLMRAPLTCSPRRLSLQPRHVLGDRLDLGGAEALETPACLRRRSRRRRTGGVVFTGEGSLQRGPSAPWQPAQLPRTPGRPRRRQRHGGDAARSGSRRARRGAGRVVVVSPPQARLARQHDGEETRARTSTSHAGAFRGCRMALRSHAAGTQPAQTAVRGPASPTSRRSGRLNLSRRLAKSS